MRRLAFRKALSERIKAGDVLTIDKFIVPELKTKSFMGLLKKQTDARKVLLVSDAFDQNTLKSGRNVKPVTLATASDVNTGAIARLRENSRYAQGAGKIGGTDSPVSKPRTREVIP